LTTDTLLAGYSSCWKMLNSEWQAKKPAKIKSSLVNARYYHYTRAGGGTGGIDFVVRSLLMLK
jgi:hypothetical protein